MPPLLSPARGSRLSTYLGWLSAMASRAAYSRRPVSAEAVIVVATWT
jgi:hypothetical protein